jgi:Leucine-rich repeat (LRR) protein
LQNFYCDENRIADIPICISQLQNLQALFLNNNEITSLPPEARPGSRRCAVRPAVAWRLGVEEI